MPKTWTVIGFSRPRARQGYRLLRSEAEAPSSELAAVPRLPPGPSSEENVLGRLHALRFTWTNLAIAFATAVAAVAGTIGPDARWLAALGGRIAGGWAISNGVPFAEAPSADWANAPALAELVFHSLAAALGDRGLLLAQLVAVAIGLGVLARDMRRSGATDAGAAAAIVILVAGALLAFAGVKAQLFSLALFPIALSLLRADRGSLSKRIWLLLPLLALWSNLHGAALVGWGVALTYLLVDRARRKPLESLAVAAGATLALCLTPALTRTPGYYAGALSNEAARRGYGLWAPLSLHSGFDLLLIAGAALFLVGFARSRPRLWEALAAGALAAATTHASRNGIWLLMLTAGPAAAAIRLQGRPRVALGQVLAGALAVVVALAVVRGPFALGASDRVVASAIAGAHDRPILAEPATAEKIAEAGGRVWISNPLDAFRKSDQRLYLDWLQGRPAGGRALRAARVVVVAKGSTAERSVRKSERFHLLSDDRATRAYVRTGRSALPESR